MNKENNLIVQLSLNVSAKFPKHLNFSQLFPLAKTPE
jgi:hypothetical protein